MTLLAYIFQPLPSWKGFFKSLLCLLSTGQEQKPAASRIDKVVKLMDLEIEPCVDKVSGAMKQKKEAMISMQTGVSDQLKSEIRKVGAISLLDLKISYFQKIFENNF